MLNNDATPDELLRAVAANHRREWMESARALGGEMRRLGGVTCIWSPVGSDPRITLAFPTNDASAPLDAVLEYCRSRDPLPTSVGCWALRDESDAATRELGVRLAARGFEWGWQAHWMSLDLATLQNVDGKNAPQFGVRIALVDEPSPVWDVDDLPYYTRRAAANVAPLPTLPHRWRFAAWQGESVVGHATLFVTRGALGAAGIYAMGVVPSARRQGVGAALMNAACRFARDHAGCRWALLNATGEGEALYRSLGWQSLGHGQTWWLHKPVLEAAPPTTAQIAFAESIGRGDTAALDELAQNRQTPADLDALLANGQTPFQFAARAEQKASADWLLGRGATPDVLGIWDLGEKTRAAELLAARPDLANRRAGRYTPATLLHEAVLRGDAELARVLLSAGPDLTIKDLDYHSTPLGWARHLGRTEITALIEEHEGQQEKAEART